MSNINSHRDLDAWKLSMELAKEVYSITSSFPKEEICGLSIQMKRAAISIPSNIAEGAARSTNADCIRFLYISLGSLSELETQLDLAYSFNFVNNIDTHQDKIKRIRHCIFGLIRYLNNKSPNPKS